MKHEVIIPVVRLPEERDRYRTGERRKSDSLYCLSYMSPWPVQA